MGCTGPLFVRHTQRKHPGKQVEVWFQDEARFGQQGTLTHVWAQKGSRPTAIKQTEYEWVYLFAAVNPVTGDSSAMLAPTVNTAPAVHQRASRPRQTRCVGVGSSGLARG